MEFIRTFREKQQTRRQADIEAQAEQLITLADFADSLYIAYGGTPLVPIQKDWTSQEIIMELSKLRQNYINSRMVEHGRPRVAAVI